MKSIYNHPVDILLSDKKTQTPTCIKQQSGLPYNNTKILRSTELDALVGQYFGKHSNQLIIGFGTQDTT